MHSLDLFQKCLLAVYVSVLFFVALYGFHRYVLVYLYLKHRDNIYQPKGKFVTLPRITIQLPMFNEDQVAERIIRHTCQIDYPLDRLEIQVLDDSNDESAETARRTCEEWAARGYPIKYLHRDNRTGYKAGALAEGMEQATGDFIAIFDADFIPPRDILRNVVNYFHDDKIGMVQVRWDHLNRDASLLTKGQAIFLDGHFVIEHTARNRSGRFMHFNGTAGVWRRKTIEDAGGWQHDTLTEDLDLSYRAQIKGWQFVYLPQFCAPAELPPEMIGFKQQAHRWTKGSVQTAIKLLPRILRSKHLSYGIKTEAFFHLTNTIVYPLMVLLTLLIYPVFFGYSNDYNVVAPLKEPTWGHFLFNVGLFVLATCSASTFFVFGQRELFGKEAGWKTLLYLPFLMGLGIGIGLNNAKAVFEAVWGAIRHKPSVFVRTPKYGVMGQKRASIRCERVLTFKRLWLPVLEISFGVYMSVCILISLLYGFGYGTIPFLIMFAGGYFYVGFASLSVLLKMNKDAEVESDADLAAAVVIK
ncbi:MAG TPA: glycosyltransferase [Tepidisphaeraceae bacterium]|jgi:cellulose synthase/poly-beta-1,6-N-acetylglucosamine synthase-like glycosyltransferase|nr:glycosyltransferase [Tepidisphaeraceae bacterium]